MELREQLNGIQHVGIPTNDIEMTIAFYEKLGFVSRPSETGGPGMQMMVNISR